MANTKSRIRKSILQAATAAFALILLHVIAAHECRVFHNVLWAAFQLLRPAILAAKTSVPADPCQASTFLQYLLQIVASNWPLPQALVG
jgi:hypothetical protein